MFEGYGLARQLGATYKDHLKALQTQVEADKKALPKQYGNVHGVADKPQPLDISVNIRGNPHNLGPEVPRRFVSVLVKAEAPPYKGGSGRLDLAEDIVTSPLAVRVIVNRVWKWHFGTGLVNTPDNFGKMGEAPSDPELLEFLASTFVQEGMSLKKLHRRILLSSVYQLSADDSPANREKDPANRLYWRFNRQRLDAEEIRDSVLFVGGVLDLKDVSGPSSEFNDENVRRTVFGKVSRYRLDNTLQVFDFPTPTATAEHRFATNVPLQRLYFMNSSVVYKQAERVAKRALAEPDDEARIRKTYQSVFGRQPSPAESKLALEFFAKNPDKPGETVAGEPSTAWKQYVRVLLSSNEFEFVD